MAILFRPCFQISSGRLSSPRVVNVVEIIVNSNQSDQRSLWSWCSRKQESPAASKCKPENVYEKSSCRKLLPQCPEHIDKGEPSKCCEQGYGQPIKTKRSWFSLKSPPVILKQKPSNCDPPPCPKEESFLEYILGPEQPLPDPQTCRRAWKLKQSCNYEDPRLDDPRYQATEGDVLVYTEPVRIKAQPLKEPQPQAPSPYRAPAGVICKRIRDSVAATALECYCACADPCLLEKCPDTNLCPVHSKPFRFPYDEMKPRNRRKKFFSCKHGIAAEDVMLPPRRESCSCVHSAFAGKTDKFPPEPEVCDLHEALQRRGEVLKRNECVEGANRKMSKCERLRMIMTSKESQISEVKIVMKTPLMPCESRCKELVVQS